MFEKFDIQMFDAPTVTDFGFMLRTDKLALDNINATYLSQSTASSTYLSQTDAASTYLTQANASETYATQDDLNDAKVTAEVTANGVNFKDGAGNTIITIPVMTSAGS